MSVLAYKYLGLTDTGMDCYYRTNKAYCQL